MVKTKLIGGLGNQMFQYAAGRSLATQHGVPLACDVRAFEDYPLHNGFELAKVFTGDFPTTQLGSEHHVVEPHFHYWSGFWGCPRDCYLEGYWQSEKYFHSISDVLRDNFTFRHSYEGQNELIASLIAKFESVSIHIRRGDYVSNPETHAFHGVLPLAYYQTAVQFMLDHLANPVFFVFSDDPEWALKNLKLQQETHVITGNAGAYSYKDMQLMSECHHQIIANSSFSWWGAWLNRNPDKVVVAPRQWFATDQLDTADLIPQAWHRVPF